MRGIMDAPTTQDGKLMEWFSYSCEEKIGLPNYSNVTVGPATVARWIDPDNKEERDAVVTEVHKILGEQREIILNIVKKQTK